jgi:hypothetical protein
MHVSAKKIPVETTPGIKGGGIKESCGGGEFKYLMHCKNLCKCYNVPPPNNTKGT